MDKQLACATFATLLPVLVIAGYFSGEMHNLAGKAISVRITIWLAVGIFALGEFASVIGTASPHPSAVSVVMGEYAALLLVSGITSAAGMRLTSTPRDQQRTRDRDDQQGGGDAVRDDI